MADHTAADGIPVPPETVAAKLERLIAEGVIGADCAATRPLASQHSRIRLLRPVSPLISEQRR